MVWIRLQTTNTAMQNNKIEFTRQEPIRERAGLKGVSSLPHLCIRPRYLYAGNEILQRNHMSLA